MIDDHTTGRRRAEHGEVSNKRDSLEDLDVLDDLETLDAEAFDDLELLDDEVEIDLDTIVSIDGGRPPGADPSSLRPTTWRPGISRRGLLRTAFVGATAVGMTAIGVFPPAREALADGYDMDKTGCAGIQYRNCKDCCCSTVCFDCCNHKGWHKRTGVYRLRPNQCHAGGGNRTKDGWFWRACSCRKRNGRRGKRTNRCHDGYKIGSAGAVRTICRKRIGCL